MDAFRKPACKQCIADSKVNIIFICANCGRSETESVLFKTQFAGLDYSATVCSENCRRDFNRYLIPIADQLQKLRSIYYKDVSRYEKFWQNEMRFGGVDPPFVFRSQLRSDTEIKVYYTHHEKCTVCKKFYCAYCGSSEDVTPLQTLTPSVYGEYYVFCKKTNCATLYGVHLFKKKGTFSQVETPYVMKSE